ncbi:homocysteine S-methyltransferase [Erwinia psidii]|uniref:S-methylmethionine:homocysteine methyltransferase n=1 Tax=Erwinia psidii TaxID=69224 RepID=A0A3N6RYM1_9GAMM|nr:homocysteine S-methyltransferase [Erwinia psidii]MCX8957074.1 homocysteine S-methyltransferase [Erwinia psidii]MCX8961726.1 homocysteine S-methyltransferase [Erwinia psidii]MCX8965320.1 homocysteine S-methyltransferase [Erwinia psidii]RQM37547.1 homocysteine S-methyltransferase [Erwinia psidii]
MSATEFSVQQQVASGLVLDGAMATELEARGCDLTDSLWSAKVLLENPELIYQVHLDYFKAGAQVAITASYQATPQGFASRGLNEADSLALIARSVELAIRARADYRAEQRNTGTLLIAGSVGPYGAFLADGSEYRGDYSLPQPQMMDFHRPRIRALVDAGVDILACETLPSFAETGALVTLLKEFPNTPAWFSFTLRDSKHLSDGTPLSEVAVFLEKCPQVVALGINCIALDKVTASLQTLSSLTAKPLVVYPNSGEQYDAISKTWHSDAASCHLIAHLEAWQNAGAKLIGGCCRTTPADITAIAQYCHSR